MILNDEALNKLSETATLAALKAGKIIKSVDRSRLVVERKEGGENLASQVVTEIDVKAQEAILEELTPTLTEFDLGLLAEESKDDGSRFKKDFFWCIDPLDGTLAFSRDEDGYSVSIALVKKDGTPTIGVVYNPRTNTLYSAIQGKGAFKNNIPLKIQNKGTKLILLYDQSFLKIDNYESEIKKLESLALDSNLSGVELHHLGGAVMNGISTIEFAPAVYYKHPKVSLGGGSIWDFAASSIIQKEAGGNNSNYFGKPLDLNRANSTFMNHEGVIYTAGIDLKIF